MGDNGGRATVLVTGASGFIGRHVVACLRDSAPSSAALAVIAATRDGRDGTRRLDLTETAGLAAGVDGVSAIVHCAVGDRSVTVDGTRALLAAAARAGVRRCIHFSSVAVYGPTTGTITEATPTVPPAGSGYAAWKSAAEECCIHQSGMEIVRLRPAIVYGPGSDLWVAQLAKRIEAGRWGTFGEAGDGNCNLVHVRDVVRGVMIALTKPGIAGAAFNLSGIDGITWNEWFTRVAAALGAPALRKVSPLELRARVYASLPLKAAARIRPGFAAHWLLGAPARSEMELFARRITYSTKAAEAALGWSPQVGVDDGLAECVAWLQAGQPTPCT